MKFPAFKAVFLAASAAALFLLNIVFICRPFRKRTPRSKDDGKCDETEVLLGADVEHQPAHTVCEEPGARDGAIYPADRWLSPQALGDGRPDCSAGATLPGVQHLQEASNGADSHGVPTTPDDVMIQLEGDTAPQIHALDASPLEGCIHVASGRPYSAPEPASNGSDTKSGASIIHSTASCSTAGDPDERIFLQGLLDTGLGPPKFSISKVQQNIPAESLQAPLLAGCMSLEQLLCTSLGPPKFSIPNPDLSPTLAHLPASSPVYASDSTSSPNVASTPELDILHHASKLNGDSILPAALSIAASSRSSSISSSSSSSSSSHSVYTIASPASAAVYQQLNSKLPRASSKRASLLPVVVESGPPHLRWELISGPGSGKVVMMTDTGTNYRIGRLPQCEFQILDQEVSGKHAELSWASHNRAWELTDAGSLNGTVLNGTIISTEYKKMGLPHALRNGDIVEFGSETKARVTLVAPVETAGMAAVETSGASAAKRPHTGRGAQSLSVPGESVHSSRLDPNPGRLTFAFGSSSRQLNAPSPTPLASLRLPHLRAHMAVQQMIGVEHVHLGQGCEDVVHWEESFSPFQNTALLCLFDGHQGVRAADAAKNILPTVMRAAATLSPHTPPQPSFPSFHAPAVNMAEAGSSSKSAESKPTSEASSMKAPELLQQSIARSAPQFSAAGPSSTSKQGSVIDIEADSARSAAAAAAAAAAAVSAAQKGACVPPAVSHTDESLLLPPPLLGWRTHEAQKALLTSVFLEADSQMTMDEGCTASAVIVQAEVDGSWVVQSANVGDSSAILVDVTSHQWVKLTGDHRISTSSSERARLEQRGHTVRTRLYGLNISRMLGDRCLKEENIGFLAEPHVSTPVIVPAGHVAFLILASDGLWDVVTEATAAEQVLKAAAASTSIACPTGSSSSEASKPVAGSVMPDVHFPLQQKMPSVEELASALLQQALLLRSKDDITIMVMRLADDACR